MEQFSHSDGRADGTFSPTEDTARYRKNRLMYSITRPCRVAVFVLLATLPLRAQQAGVRVSGQVSAVAAVSAGSAVRVVKGDAQVSARADGAHGLVLSVSGTRGGETHIEFPAQLRSNVGFDLIASCKTDGTRLSAFSVVEVSGAGKFVQPGAVGRVEIPSTFDGRVGARAPSGGGLDLSSPVTILHAPPISLGGTLDSPGNMIEVVLRIILAAPPGEQNWHAELRVSAAPRVGAGQSAPLGRRAG